MVDEKHRMEYVIVYKQKIRFLFSQKWLKSSSSHTTKKWSFSRLLPPISFLIWVWKNSSWLAVCANPSFWLVNRRIQKTNKNVPKKVALFYRLHVLGLFWSRYFISSSFGNIIFRRHLIAYLINRATFNIRNPRFCLIPSNSSLF